MTETATPPTDAPGKHRSLDDSRADGPHRTLAAMEGHWEGSTKVWFEPGVLADESPTRGTIRPVLDGRFALHEYEGSLRGKPVQGVAIYGFHLDADAFQMAWVDTFHTGSEIQSAEGTPGDDTPRVLAHYGDGRGGPPWGWRTEITQPDPDRLVISAYNIDPSGAEALAVETRYTRSGPLTGAE